MFNDRVLPFYEEQDVPLPRVLTDHGTEYCGNRESHERFRPIDDTVTASKHYEECHAYPESSPEHNSGDHATKRAIMIWPETAGKAHLPLRAAFIDLGIMIVL